MFLINLTRCLTRKSFILELQVNFMMLNTLGWEVRSRRQRYEKKKKWSETGENGWWKDVSFWMFVSSSVRGPPLSASCISWPGSSWIFLGRGSKPSLVLGFLCKYQSFFSIISNIEVFLRLSWASWQTISSWSEWTTIINQGSSFENLPSGVSCNRVIHSDFTRSKSWLNVGFQIQLRQKSPFNHNLR